LVPFQRTTQLRFSPRRRVRGRAPGRALPVADEESHDQRKVAFDEDLECVADSLRILIAR
jgi:hypothetical protein